MSDRDPNPFGRRCDLATILSLVEDDLKSKPTSAAQDIATDGATDQSTGAKVSEQSQHYRLLGRVQSLESGQQAIWQRFQELAKSFAKLSQAFEISSTEIQALQKKLNEFEFGTMDSASAEDKVAKLNISKSPAQGGGSLPPHLRKKQAQNGSDKAETQQQQPHIHSNKDHDKGEANIMRWIRAVDVDDGPVSNGKIIPSTQVQTQKKATLPTPPKTPVTIETVTSFKPDVARPSIEDPYIAHSGRGWMPTFIANLVPLDDEQLSKIPSPKDMVSFSPDFLQNQIGGTTWSPGYIIVEPRPDAPHCLLKGRSYYLMDNTVEPYLPRAPGQHGAKLTPFFNDHPSEVFDEEWVSYDDVPLFLNCSPWATDKDKKRYVYFGNYSQTRWSDKLDYDRMIEQVPIAVKEYWAEELSAKGRPDWVTNELMNHFFPRPEFDEARLPPVDDEDEEVQAKMAKDAVRYINVLRNWHKEASMRTKLIKKEFILSAFHAADADQPEALRLQWEYLQCTGWDKGFYDLLVTLQGRNPALYL